MLRPPNAVNTSPYVPPVDPIAPLRAALRGHYDIEREIGQGAFATVYLARDLKHERKVAVKVLNADPTSDIGELRFIREIRTLARLQHPNILPLHDSGHVEALLYYVMPYVSGDTVRDRIDRDKQMSVEAACSIARDVADALAYAHAQGIIHRDIKPENILLSTGHPILADFGIARAIDLAGVRQLTRTGANSPGTPAYMSPEQLMGDKELDGRSDTYSLGCVLFEMLTGKPPFAGKEGFVKRFTEPPPKASSLRKDLPSWLDDAIERALQREPRDRFPTAKEFVAALSPPESSGHAHHAVAGSVDHVAHRSLHLEGVSDGTAQPVDWDKTGRTLRLPSWRVLAPGLVAAVLLIAGIARRQTIAEVLRPAQLDSSRIAVLPFRGDRAQADLATRNFEDALGRWQDLQVASGVEVSDALANGVLPASLRDVRAVAGRLRTRRLVWGEVSRTGDTFRARAELYDLAGPSDGPSRTVIVDGAPGERDAIARASMAILKKSDTPKWADGGDGATRSFAAWSAYGEGHIAIANLNLAQAEASFADAVSKDPQFAAARGWLAQVQQWSDPDSSDWRVNARSALAGVGTLNARDRLIVLAVGALSAGAYPEACGRYAELAQADSSSFLGWYGSGECRLLDKGVIADPKSPSGWKFRSSLHTATRMYLHALQLEPRVHALLTFARIERLLPTGTNVLRPGSGIGTDSARFAGMASLAADTVAFVPYPVEKLSVVPSEAIRTQNAALQRNSDQLLSFASEWTRQFPNSPDAHEALSDVLEVRGEVADGPGRSQSALAAILRAQTLTSDPHQQLRLSAREVRLRLKRSEFARAGALADSVLGRYDAASQEDANELIGLAALAGKIDQTARLARFGIWPLAVARVAIAPSLGEAAANLFAHAALGACEPGARSLEAALEGQLQSYVPENQRNQIRGVLATRSFSMLSPCTGALSSLRIEAPYDPLFRMQQAFARKDLRMVRTVLDSLAKERRDSRPGDLTLDYTYQEAWLKTAIGDTAGAIRQLDLALNALPSLNGISFRDPGVAAAVGRTFALRADLAFAQRDFRPAKHWADALLAIWRRADTPLQPTVIRMKKVASFNPA